MKKYISIVEIVKFLNKLSEIVKNSNNGSFLMFLTSSCKVKVINNNGNMEFYIFHPKVDENKKFNKKGEINFSPLTLFTDFNSNYC